MFLLISKIPTYSLYLQNELIPVLIKKINIIDDTMASRLKNPIQHLTSSIFSLMSNIVSNIWTYTLVTINIITISLFVPIILLYLLKDWHRIIASISALLPLHNKNNIKEIIYSINILIAAYIRGQLNICTILATFYAISLSLIGLDFGLLLGILSGFLIIIPFIGTLISLICAIIVGYFTFGVNIDLIYIIMLYTCGSLVENYILTPKMIGERIGLHPVWIMFSLLICSNAFGFIGIFFAIPIAGILKILFCHAIDYYKSSDIYNK
jgi:putative permease